MKQRISLSRRAKGGTTITVVLIDGDLTVRHACTTYSNSIPADVIEAKKQAARMMLLLKRGANDDPQAVLDYLAALAKAVA